MIFEHELVPYSLSEIPDGPYLVFAPHPDDETLGMGGTILLASNAGIDISVVFVTNGDKGGIPEIRKHETHDALKILGVRKRFSLNLFDRKVADSHFPEDTLNKIIEEVQPLTLFLPSFQEIHPDHRAVTHKVLSFLSRHEYPFNLWFYEINRQGEVNRIIDITSVLDLKESAIECYKSQLAQLDYKSHTLCLDFARSISLCGNSLYAEGFWHYNLDSGMTPENEYFHMIDRYRSDYCPSSYGRTDNMEKNKIIGNKSLNSYKLRIRAIIERLQVRLFKIYNSKYKKSVSSLKHYGHLYKKLRESRPFSMCCCETNLGLNPERPHGLCNESARFLPRAYLPGVRLFALNKTKNPCCNKYMDCEGLNHFMGKCVPLELNIPLVFKIKCSFNNFSGLDLLLATYQRINPGRLILNLYDDPERKLAVRTSQVQTENLVDNKFVSFYFETIENSMDREFLISVELKDGVREKCVGLWTHYAFQKSKAEYYNTWIEKAEPLLVDSAEKIRLNLESFDYMPCISILLYITGNDVGQLIETVESVLGQIYSLWQLILIYSGELDSDMTSVLEKKCQEDSRIILKKSEISEINEKENHAIHERSEFLNQVLYETENEFIFVLDQYDTLSLYALYEVVKLLNKFPDADLIYSDEDKISMQGKRVEPYFKPDWSQDLLLSCMYLGSFNLYRTALLKKAGGFSRTFKSCQRYDIALRLTELTQLVFHIPMILYHRRNVQQYSSADVNNIDYFDGKEAGKVLFQAVLRRRIDAGVDNGLTACSFRVFRRIKEDHFISIIIPFRDAPEILKTCVESIIEKTEYDDYEIICVNNKSIKKETFDLIERLNAIHKVKVIDYNAPFNYSAINNFAVSQSKGDMLLFLNSDTEVISGKWVSAMLEHAERKKVGAVGAKLYYIDDTIQHGGVVVGIAGIAGHAFKYISRYDTDYYYGFPCMIRNVSAVTGACMMVRKSVFEDLGGFDEEDLKIHYNDLDFCLKARQKGYEIIYTPFAELYHYESYSRGYDFDPSVADKMLEKWGDMVKNDPFYNSNLTKSREDWSLEILESR